MDEQNRTRIIMGFVFIGMLVCFWLVGNAAYIAGGRKACENTEGMVLVVGFRCEPEQIVQITKDAYNFSIEFHR